MPNGSLNRVALQVLGPAYIAALLVLSGCGPTRGLLPTIPYYEGPILPDEQVAIIHHAGDVMLTGVNDKSYKRLEPVAVLPGSHFITATIYRGGGYGIYYGVDFHRCGYFTAHLEADTEYLLKDRDNERLILTNVATNEVVKSVNYKCKVSFVS